MGVSSSNASHKESMRSENRPSYQGSLESGTLRYYLAYTVKVFMAEQVCSHLQ